MTETTTELEVSRPMPVWMSVVVIVLCLGGGGWVLHWYVATDAMSTETSIIDDSVQKPRKANAPAAPAPAIRQVDANAGIWTVRAPEATLKIAHPKGKPAQFTSLVYNTYAFVPQDIRDVLAARTRLTADEGIQKAVKLTPEQVTQLKALTKQRVTMAVTQPEKDRVMTLWNAYENEADKNGNQAKLVAAISEISRNEVEATRKMADDIAGKIRAVLTDEQWKSFNALGK